MIASLLYNAVVLLVLFSGGYLLLRYGMAVDPRISFYIAAFGMPVATFALWLAGYRGKRFK